MKTNSVIGVLFAVTGWLGAFGVIALLLAGLGLYGVVAQDVLNRTRELAVRSALGASPGRLMREVVRDGARLTAIGLVFGVAASFVSLRVVRGGTGAVGQHQPRADGRHPGIAHARLERLAEGHGGPASLGGQ